MKIAFILNQSAMLTGRSNGIRCQALTWAKLLESRGHIVDLVNEWDYYEWESYDVVHIFGDKPVIYAPLLARYCQNVHWSPIYDPSTGYDYRKWHITQYLRIKSKGRLYGLLAHEECNPYIARFSVRSEFEKEHVMKLFHLPMERISIVPLSVSDSCKPYEVVDKEPFCLHISLISQKRKNVVRLIEAAKKYNFKLILAGNKGTEAEFQPLKDAIGDNKNIKVLGYISEEQKVALYKRAKVFALPSVNEGVGIVALDAAYYGCEIVITNIPGPKEYYDGRCVEVDPLSIDEIGSGIMKLLKGEVSYQPLLSKYIMENYSMENVAKILENSYMSSK